MTECIAGVKSMRQSYELCGTEVHSQPMRTLQGIVKVVVVVVVVSVIVEDNCIS